MKFSSFIAIVTLAALCVADVTAKSQRDSFTVVEADITDMQQAMNQGTLTSETLVKRYLDRIKAYDQQGPAVNAIIRINPNALQRAIEMDQERSEKGPRSLLHGIPVILKDNFNTHDIPTSAGSVALAGFIPSEDAFQVKKLRDAGAIVLAKANMTELAYGVTGESALGGQTKNPYDLTRVPGGSSSGSAVAAAASFAAITMGTDTCSSISSPVAYNNLVGMRSTKGLSSISGIIPLIPSMDVAGPMARTIRDLAITLDVTTGYDPGDPYTKIMENKQPSAFVASLGSLDLSSLTFGKVSSYYGRRKIHPEVLEAFNRTVEALIQQGAAVIDIELETIELLTPEIMEEKLHEIVPSLNKFLSNYPGSSENTFSEDIANLGIHSDFISFLKPPPSVDIEPSNNPKISSSKKLSLMMSRTFQDQKIDALIYLSTEELPVKIDESQGGHWSCTLSALSGFPSLTLPAGFTASGIPVGMSLLGPYLDDERLVAIGYAIEKNINHRRSPLVTPPLANGKAPKLEVAEIGLDLGVKVKFEFDVTKTELRYKTFIANRENVHAICLHQFKDGPIIQCLSGINGRRSKGQLQLNFENVKRLREGTLHVRAYSKENPLGGEYSALVFPQ